MERPLVLELRQYVNVLHDKKRLQGRGKDYRSLLSKREEDGHLPPTKLSWLKRKNKARKCAETAPKLADPPIEATSMAF